MEIITIFASFILGRGLRTDCPPELNLVEMLQYRLLWERSNIDLDRYRWLKEKANIDFNDHVNVYGRTSLKMMSIRIDEEIKRANMMEKSECCKAGSMQEKRKAELAPLAA